MCTTVVDIDPRSPVPVLLLGARDEFADRAWLPPGRHWPEHPALVGGQDLQALGTWLAVNPQAPRVACVLNAHGEAAAESRRLTRGTLPLRAAASGQLGKLGGREFSSELNGLGELGELKSANELNELNEFDEREAARYDPFHLICASPEVTRVWSWNGRTLGERTLGAGLHFIVNSGLEGADEHEGPGSAQMRARIQHFRPLFEKALRPEPESGKGSAESAWGGWLPLAAGGGLDPSDARALVLRRSIEDRQWGTSSLSLVALTRTTARYDFCANPTAPRPAWSRVL